MDSGNRPTTESATTELPATTESADTLYNSATTEIYARKKKRHRHTTSKKSHRNSHRSPPKNHRKVRRQPQSKNPHRRLDTDQEKKRYAHDDSQRQPDIHLFAARFKEQNGDIPGARAAYRVVHAEIAPGLLEAITKHANMERRLGNLEDAFSLYEQATAIEKGKELPLVLPAFSDSVNTASAAEREELSCIFLEFLGIFGDAQSIQKAADRHAKFFLPHSSKSELKKSDAEDYLSSDRAKIAKPYSDGTSPPQSLMGAYTSAQNQWTAGYGLQPQAWPPATQEQTQQWTPGFNQQAFPQQSYAQPAAALTPA